MPVWFKQYLKYYIPVGSVYGVNYALLTFYGTPSPSISYPPLVSTRENLIKLEQFILTEPIIKTPLLSISSQPLLSTKENLIKLDTVVIEELPPCIIVLTITT